VAARERRTGGEEMKKIIMTTAMILWALTALAQTPPAPAKAPQDEPIASRSEKDAQALEEAIKPYVEEARKTYPEAKARFLAGLPAKQGFYVSTRLTDSKGRKEQAFIRVDKIADGYIDGKIRSRLRGVEGFKYGDSYRFPEKDLVDWVILRPDGTEEGNVVGKFLDNYRKTMKKEGEAEKKGGEK
jgi:hypothetical protein